jgi:hypothetical protein
VLSAVQTVPSLAIARLPCLGFDLISKASRGLLFPGWRDKIITCGRRGKPHRRSTGRRSRQIHDTIETAARVVGCIESSPSRQESRTCMPRPPSTKRSLPARATRDVELCRAPVCPAIFLHSSDGLGWCRYPSSHLRCDRRIEIDQGTCGKLASGRRQPVMTSPCRLRQCDDGRPGRRQSVCRRTVQDGSGTYFAQETASAGRAGRKPVLRRMQS